MTERIKPFRCEGDRQYNVILFTIISLVVAVLLFAAYREISSQMKAEAMVSGKHGNPVRLKDPTAFLIRYRELEDWCYSDTDLSKAIRSAACDEYKSLRGNAFIARAQLKIENGEKVKRLISDTSSY